MIPVIEQTNDLQELFWVLLRTTRVQHSLLNYYLRFTFARRSGSYPIAGPGGWHGCGSSSQPAGDHAASRERVSGKNLEAVKAEAIQISHSACSIGKSSTGSRVSRSNISRYERDPSLPEYAMGVCGAINILRSDRKINRPYQWGSDSS